MPQHTSSASERDFSTTLPSSFNSLSSSPSVNPRSMARLKGLFPKGKLIQLIVLIATLSSSKFVDLYRRIYHLQNQFSVAADVNRLHFFLQFNIKSERTYVRRYSRDLDFSGTS